MPTYDYKCEKCGDRFEHFQSMSSEPLHVCKKCGGKLHRLLGEGAGVIFKGGGFYCTDYHSKNNVSSETHEAKTENGVKSDSKPSSTPASASSSGK